VDKLLENYVGDAATLSIEAFKQTHGIGFLIHCPEDQAVEAPGVQATIAMMPVLSEEWAGDDAIPHVFALRKGGLDANAITVGRGTWCDICLPHPSVSRCHAFFSRVGDRFQITDNGSENGTFLSRKQLVAGRPAVLRPGQIIQLGDVRLVYLPAIRFVQYLAAESTNPINRVDRIEMRR